MNQIEQKDLPLPPRQAEQAYHLASRVGVVSNPDKSLFSYYLNERLLRTSIYNSSWLLSSPMALALIRLPIIKYLVKAQDRLERYERSQLEDTHQYIDNYIQLNYPGPDNRLRARTIELAVNDLVALGTCAESTQTRVRFNPSENALKMWSGRWSRQLDSSTD